MATNMEASDCQSGKVCGTGFSVGEAEGGTALRSPVERTTNVVGGIGGVAGAVAGRFTGGENIGVGDRSLFPAARPLTVNRWLFLPWCPPGKRVAAMLP